MAPDPPAAVRKYPQGLSKAGCALQGALHTQSQPSWATKQSTRKRTLHQELPLREGSKQSCAKIPLQHSPASVTAFTRKKSITFQASFPTCSSHAARPPHGHPARVAGPPLPSPTPPCVNVSSSHRHSRTDVLLFQRVAPLGGQVPRTGWAGRFAGTGRCPLGCTAREVKSLRMFQNQGSHLHGRRGGERGGQGPLRGRHIRAV